MSGAGAAAGKGARPHPLVTACLALLGARAVGLVLHFTSRDPNGNPISASPFEQLLIAIPYNGWVLLPTTAALLLLWMLLPRLRPGVTALGVAAALVLITLGQVDLGLRWFIGQRFSPMEASTYVGGSLLSNDWLAPLRFHPGYLATGLAILLVPWALIGWSAWAARRGPVLAPARWMVVTLVVLAALCRMGLSLTYGHQRDVHRPTELLFVHHWLSPNEAPAPADEARAVAELRAAADPAGGSHWLDPRLPLVRAAPAARSRFRDAAAPAARPDIFLFAVESLRGAEVGYVPGNPGGAESATPRLDRLAQQGVVFSRYIANGFPSPRGFFAINAGVWDHRESFIVARWTDTEFDALPLRLRRAGYFTLAMWGANASFDNQLFWANRWYDRIRSSGPEGPLGIARSLPDDRLVDQLLAEIAAHDAARPDQPTFAYVATVGTHEPYTIEEGSDAPPELVERIAAEKDPRRRYREVLRHLDAQIGRVLDALAARPTARPWLVIVVGDHSDAAGDRIPPEMRDLPHNAIEWTAALIAGPRELIGPPRVETFASSHVDLTPTLLDLVGDRGPTATMGTNLFADVPPERRTALSVSGQGYRLDRDGWSLFVRREHPDAIYTRPAFAPIERFVEGVEGSPFTAADASRLWENMNTWSYLIENDRVWRAELLGAAP